MRIGKIAILAIAMITRAEIGRGHAIEPEIGRFRAHVATLASREFGGRRGVGGELAATYVADEFQRLGLEPAFGKSYRQNIVEPGTGHIIGRNIGARIVGSDPKLRDEWIVVGAHFDHLGTYPQAMFPGADDNASGTAMMLEAARCFAQSPEKPRRSVLFLGFDLEEDMLTGSRYFVNHPPIPIAKIKLFVTADMIGRALGGVCDEFVFAFGADTTPGLRSWVVDAARDEPFRLGLLGNDVLVVDRSDYGPFRRLSIPYLFFSTGENPHYHRPSDTADTLDYPKAVATCRTIYRVLVKAANSDDLGGWNPATEPSFDEAIAVRDVLRLLEANREKLKVKPAPLIVLRNTLKTLDGIVARGAITPRERAGVIRSAQFLLFSVL